jgi:putative chitinase
MIDRKHFFDTVREGLFKGAMTRDQVHGMEAILREWEAQQLTDLRWLAYILATAYHETAKTMQPIAEYGKGKKYDYGKKLKMGGGPGKRIAYETPDKIYYGRGHTQNTWYENYQRLTKAAATHGKPWDFLKDPDLLLQMEPSIWATFFAMQVGLYTGRKLSDYFNEHTVGATDQLWINARKIINGLDCAEKIATYAKVFHEAVIGLVPVQEPAPK